MLELDNARLKLHDITESLNELSDALHLQNLQKEKKELELLQDDTNLFNDIKKAQEVNKKLKQICSKINKYKVLETKAEELSLTIEIVDETDDKSEVENIYAEIENLDVAIDDLHIVTLLRGKYDGNNAILSLHAGAGGTEAQDWCEMLYRMYYRYAERQGYKVKETDRLQGDEAGIKSITFIVEGENAYGFLKAEKGVHRLVRISPFDSNSRRHTSFASLEVMPEIENTDEIVIKTEDVRIDTYRSGGAGGQNVNKTESAIRITHLPTGIVVQCQNERSQLQNKEFAYKMLMSKLIEKKERENLESESSIKGELKKIEWGSQIRSYVFCPYTLVKDHRSGYENPSIQAVMDGDIHPFILDYLKKI